MEDADQPIAEADVQRCAACDGPLECRPAGGCWCMEETVSEQTLRKLEGRYEGCLCPECLRKADRAASQMGADSASAPVPS